MNLGYDAAGRVGIVPTFGRLSIGECEALLNGGLRGVNLYQLKGGVPGIRDALFTGDVVYDGYDPTEHWQSIREIWESSGHPPQAVLDYRQREGLGDFQLHGDGTDKASGDCEDLSTAIAAQETHEGRPSLARIQKIRPGLAHVVVQNEINGKLMDPNITGGMGK